MEPPTPAVLVFNIPTFFPKACRTSSENKRAKIYQADIMYPENNNITSE